MGRTHQHEPIETSGLIPPRQRRVTRCGARRPRPARAARQDQTGVSFTAVMGQPRRMNRPQRGLISERRTGLLSERRPHGVHNAPPISRRSRLAKPARLLGARRRTSAGWLATRARTDQAHVTVYSLHVLQKRVQNVIRSAKRGTAPSIKDLETIRKAVLRLWHDAHQLTPPGVPLGYEEFQSRALSRRKSSSVVDER